MNGLNLDIQTPIGRQSKSGGNVTWMDPENISNPAPARVWFASLRFDFR
ncbi:MAG: hypothetical protein IT186_06235 [Acidobacteria bacterium]|nr:hypothetical protein [Acidobacteriota bacterium]